MHEGTTDISWTSSARSDEWLEPETAPYRLLDLDAISKLEIFSRDSTALLRLALVLVIAI